MCSRLLCDCGEKHGPPSLWMPWAIYGINIFSFIVNGLAALDPGGTLPDSMSAGFSALALVTMVASGPRSYRAALQRRKEWRKVNFEAWLSKSVPELVKQTPWCEIERAMGALLEQDIDPTYERAEAWLASERVRQEELERQKERQKFLESTLPKDKPQRRCKHLNAERFTIDQDYTSYGIRYSTKAVCPYCGDFWYEDEISSGRLDRSSDEAPEAVLPEADPPAGRRVQRPAQPVHAQADE